MASFARFDDGVEMNDVEPDVLGTASSEGGRTRRREDEEDEEWDGAEMELPTPTERRLHLAVSVVSGLDIIVSGVLLLVAFTYAYRDNGASLACLGFQALNHAFSSLLLCLRFFAEASLPERLRSASQGGKLRRLRLQHLLREQGVSVLMGVVLLISAAVLLYRAFRKLQMWDRWYLHHEAMDEEVAWMTGFLAWYGFIAYLIQGLVRLWAALRLRRGLLWHAFVASCVSLVFMLVAGVASAYEKEWSWKAEPVAAIVLAVVSLIEGVRITIMHMDDMETRMRFDGRA